MLALSETLPRESRGFHMAFQLALLEAREAVEAVLARCRAVVAGSRDADPRRPAELCRGRAADAVRGFPRRARRCVTTWRRWRRGSACRSSRRATGCRRCSGRARAACRSSSCASIRPATYRSGSPPRGSRSRATADRARAGSCTRRSRSPARCRCRWRNCPTARRILCFARTVTRPARALGRAAAGARGGDGLRRGACRRTWSMRTGWTWSVRRWASACRAGCATARIAAAAAFPPLEHRLALDPQLAGVAPYRFETWKR